MSDARLLLLVRFLLAVVFIGFYGFIVLSVLNRETDFLAGVKDVVMFLLGALTTSVITVVGFFYTTSQSSAAKDAMLVQAATRDGEQQ